MPRIGRYRHTQATCEKPDPRAVLAAARVCRMIRRRLPQLSVEHVGSTAVPELEGKGIVDLMVLYPDGMLAEARTCLDELGFQRQDFGDPFPEDRPMRVGTLAVDGREFRVHAHVLAASSAEVADLRRFRDLLRKEPGLAAAYVERKRELIAAGIVESPDYALHKTGFIRAVLEGRERSTPAV